MRGWQVRVLYGPQRIMKITKFGHCCLLIEEGGVRIVTDPGVLSTAQNDLENIDSVLITHEHADHFHIDSVKAIVANNPQAIIITNTSVGKLLAAEGIPFTCVEHGQSLDANGALIEAFGERHALMHSSIEPIQCTGYFIAGRFYYPGDALTNPGKYVEILGLPVAGPWMKLSEAIDYALELKPKVCIPVHEGILLSPGSTHLIPPRVLEPAGIAFTILEIGEGREF